VGKGQFGVKDSPIVEGLINAESDDGTFCRGRGDELLLSNK